MRRWFLAVVALAAGLAGALLPTTAEAQNRFWLINDSGRVIQSAYVSSSRVQDWGPDILGTAVLPPGQRVWVQPNFGDCVLDVRVTYQGGGEESRMQVNACGLSQIVFSGGRPSAGAGATIGGGTGAAVAPGRQVVGNPSFVFTNGTGVTIREVYVSLSSDNNWGGDRLGANVLNPGGRLSVSLPATGVCTVDMRVVYMNGQSAERRRIETCSINEFVWR
jgi:hypothetical protein